jgi:hypothetical protein
MTFKDDVLFARVAIREGEYEEGLEIIRVTARKYPIPFAWANLRALPRMFRDRMYWRGLVLVIKREGKGRSDHGNSPSVRRPG